jgi:UDP-N-acetylmuramoyl-tripeptide--D-alanyl-D-alanine ligase
MINIELFYKKYFRPGNLTTDSRNIIKNGIFVALKGENFNGNTFSAEAIRSGAQIAVVDETEFKNDENILYVENSLEFIQQLAQYHRKKAGFKVIGLTGTNGKTTTKELIKSVLCEKYKCQATSGNLNNHIGVPLTLLSIKSETQYAIIEMGANHPGEIAQLCDIALPDFGLITNIGKAHLEGFGSFEGVVKTKSELYNFIFSTGGKIFYNVSNPILLKLVNKYSKAIKYNDQSSVSGRILSNTPTLTIEIRIQKEKNVIVHSNLYGEYNLENILAAVCIGKEFDLDVDQLKCGIENYMPDNNRSQIMKKGSNTLILDCYNANPTSMHEAISSFSKIKENSKLAILGGMRELGKYSVEEHNKLINQLKDLNYTDVLLIGDEFKGLNLGNFIHFDNLQLLVSFLEKNKYQNRHILVKGSRGNKLEKIIEFLG